MTPLLTAAERERLVAAIKEAESRTSGEIVVSIRKSVTGDPYQVAQRMFLKQNLHRTRERNAVLILLGVDSHSFAVIGDEGIDGKVPNDFWEGVSATMVNHFQNNDLIAGLESGILAVGEQLGQYFPHQSDDVNEIPDDIHVEE